jgi:hypothetical protein
MQEPLQDLSHQRDNEVWLLPELRECVDGVLPADSMTIPAQAKERKSITFGLG